MRWLRAAAATLGLLLLLASALLLCFRFAQSGPCGHGSRPCTTSPSTCIAQRSWCNGHVDCPNGDDEDRVRCADFSGSNDVLLTFFYSRKPPTAERRCLLAGQPSPCRCRETSVNCGGVGLSSVPSNIRGNITRLILLNNSIESLDSKSFEIYSTLELINLSFNKISHIYGGTFSGKSKLEKLLISNNLLSVWSVAPGEMEDLGSLLILILDSNALSDGSWPLEQLSALKSLKWLSLSNNDIKLENMEFPHLVSLKELNLTGNHLTYVGERTFMRLDMLNLLELRHNDIRSIHPAAFINLIHLQELNLAYNSLHSLSNHIFDSLGSLSQLDLSGNPLHIPGHLFFHLQNITSLSLHDIDIDNIDIRMFSVLPKLNHVYFKFYYYCSFVPHVPICKPNNDGVSSLEHLLHALPLRLTVWLVAAFTLSANVLVLSGRASSTDDNRVLSLVIRSLAGVCDDLGVYVSRPFSSDCRPFGTEPHVIQFICQIRTGNLGVWADPGRSAGHSPLANEHSLLWNQWNVPSPAYRRPLPCRLAVFDVRLPGRQRSEPALGGLPVPGHVPQHRTHSQGDSLGCRRRGCRRQVLLYRVDGRVLLGAHRDNESARPQSSSHISGGVRLGRGVPCPHQLGREPSAIHAHHPQVPQGRSVTRSPVCPGLLGPCDRLQKTVCRYGMLAQQPRTQRHHHQDSSGVQRHREEVVGTAFRAPLRPTGDGCDITDF